VIGRARRLAGDWFARLPPEQRARLKRALRPAWRGGRRRSRPLSREAGRDRGTPVMQWYEERFLREHSADLRGRVLAFRAAPEVGSGSGAGVEVVDIDPTNPSATILADLADPGSVPAASYDCVVALDALREASDPRSVVRTLWESVAPGGVVLLSSSCVQRRAEAAEEADRWRVLPAGLEGLLEEVAGAAMVHVTPLGNGAVSAAVLRGLAAEELGPACLDQVDPDAPTLVLARVERPA